MFVTDYYNRGNNSIAIIHNLAKEWVGIEAAVEDGAVNYRDILNYVIGMLCLSMMTTDVDNY